MFIPRSHISVLVDIGIRIRRWTGYQDIEYQLKSKYQTLLAFTFEDPCDPASLHLSLRHDGSQCMDETHHRQRWILHVRREHMLVESHTVATAVQAIPRQVREIVVVASGKHNCVYLCRSGIVGRGGEFNLRLKLS